MKHPQHDHVVIVADEFINDDVRRSGNHQLPRVFDATAPMRGITASPDTRSLIRSPIRRAAAGLSARVLAISSRKSVAAGRDHRIDLTVAG
jgi:hypothetical protein